MLHIDNVATHFTKVHIINSEDLHNYENHSNNITPLALPTLTFMGYQSLYPGLHLPQGLRVYGIHKQTSTLASITVDGLACG